MSASVFASEDVVCEVGFPPYWPGWIEQVDGKPQGIVVEATKKLFSSLGINRRFAAARPWTRFIHDAELGSDLFLLPTMKSRLRDEKFVFIGPIGVSRFAIYKSKNISEPKTIAVSKFFTRMEEIQPLLEGFEEVIWTESNRRALRLFEIGRVDALVGNVLAVELALKRKGLEDHFEKMPDRFLDHDLFVMTPKGSNCIQHIDKIQAKLDSIYSSSKSDSFLFIESEDAKAISL